MKLITAERLIATLNKINRISSKDTKNQEAILRLYGMHGYQNIVEKKATAVIAAVQVNTDLLNLNMKESKQIIDNFISKTNYFFNWRQIVFAIQAKHGVSGLVNQVCTLGDRSISILVEHDTLRLIKSDLDLLAQEKTKVISFFLESAKSQQHQVFLYRNGFSRCLTSDILDYAKYYQWAVISKGMGSYYQLLLVNGLDKNDCDADIKFFISSKDKPRL